MYVRAHSKPSRMRLPAFLAVLLSLGLMSGTAQPCSFSESAAEFEVVLLPIVTREWRGAYDSVWRTELSLFNGTGRTLMLFPARDLDIGPLIPFECSIDLCEDMTQYVPENSTLDAGAELFMPPDAPFPGMFLYVKREISSQISYSLRVRDLTRQSESAGTELPVVRLPEFRTRPIQLLNVPLDDRFRQTLRIYDISHVEPHNRYPSAFRVRFFSMNVGSSLPLHEMVVKPEFSRVHTGGLDSLIKPCAGTPLYPNYAEISSFRPNLPVGETAVRIEIEPLGFTGGFWAFVAVTNNETQHVTTVTPQ